MTADPSTTPVSCLLITLLVDVCCNSDSREDPSPETKTPSISSSTSTDERDDPWTEAPSVATAKARRGWSRQRSIMSTISLTKVSTCSLVKNSCSTYSHATHKVTLETTAPILKTYNKYIVLKQNHHENITGGAAIGHLTTCSAVLEGLPCLQQYHPVDRWNDWT